MTFHRGGLVPASSRPVLLAGCVYPLPASPPVDIRVSVADEADLTRRIRAALAARNQGGPVPVTFPTFAERAHHVTRHHPPRTLEVGEQLDTVREAFGRLIDAVAPFVPAGPDATTAANTIGDACQSVIAAIVRNQEEPLS